MRRPTQDQIAVLESPARVRVVRAAPGSGKTWLVAEAMRSELATWRSPTGGIAALSFTRVGGKEIRTSIGHELGHPHFIGTIDAFLFRYVVRPHLRQVFPGHFADLRLLPGEWGAEHWGDLGPGISATVGKGIKVLGCLATGEDAHGRAILTHKPHRAAPLKEVVGADLEAVLEAKKTIWRTRGFLTHSDAARWASSLLEHALIGAVLRREICRRFPVIIVDELQDTGYFLAKSILALLSERSTSGLVVGDPDQAIYEFTGARPDLFALFAGIRDAETLVLRESRRCPHSVLAPALHVKDSNGGIISSSPRTGRSFLVMYDDMAHDVGKLATAFHAAWPDGTIRIVGRSATTVDALRCQPTCDAPSLNCRPLSYAHRSIVHFRRRRTAAALADMRAALLSAAFDRESLSDDELRKKGIDSVAWNALTVRCVLGANALPTDCTLLDWQKAGAALIDRELLALGWPPLASYVPDRLRPKKRRGWNAAASDTIPETGGNVDSTLPCPVQTVHAVKGETHDCTILVCPQTTAQHCPSKRWWSDDPADREERRIAYVAMTRSRADLVLAVSKASYDRLKDLRPAFVATFQCLSVTDCIAEVRRQSSATATSN